MKMAWLEVLTIFPAREKAFSLSRPAQKNFAFSQPTIESVGRKANSKSESNWEKSVYIRVKR